MKVIGNMLPTLDTYIHIHTLMTQAFNFSNKGTCGRRIPDFEGLGFQAN